MTLHIANPLDLQKAAVILADGKVSTSRLQREMGIGYNKAAEMIENLENAEILSAPNHVGKRTLIDSAALAKIAKGEPLVATRLAKRPTTSAEPDTGVTMTIRTADGTKTLPFDPGTLKRALAEQLNGKPKMKDDPDFRKHNQDAYTVTADELRQFIERLEQLESEKKDIADQQKELMSEAKGRGYDTKVMRKVIALRKRKPDELAEEEAVLDLYKTALGMS